MNTEVPTVTAEMRLRGVKWQCAGDRVWVVVCATCGGNCFGLLELQEEAESIDDLIESVEG